MYLYILSKQNIDLSVAEVLALATNKDFKLIENYLLIDELVDYKRLAYTKSVYKLLFSCKKEKLVSKLKKYDFNMVYQTNFKLEFINNSDFKVGKLADIIWKQLKKPVVNMKNPKTKIDIIFSEKVFVCLLIEELKDEFEKRKSHLRPYNHPTSLHPRLARCLVNLVNSKQILDPFCGSGGILIEAGLLGLNIFGYDTDKIMLKRCKENLDFFKIKNYSLKKRDALTINKEFESVVTDLPYGKNSQIKDLKETYKNFLLNTSKHIKRMVVVFPDFINAKRMIKQSGWIIKNEFSYYLHKSLTKRIYLLGKNG